MSEDDGHAISYKVLRRGTPVLAAGGEQIGSVRRVQDNARENIFDGLVVDTGGGLRFVDAPEVARIAERAVTLTIDAAAVARLPEPGGRVSERLALMTTVRRSRRSIDRLRSRWKNR